MTAPGSEIGYVEIDADSERGETLLRSVAERYGETIVRAAEKVRRFFLLRSPWAPGLWFVGGQAIHAASPDRGRPSETLNLSGTGETLEEAFVSCVGEGIERLVVFERAGDIQVRAALSEVSNQVTPDFMSLIEHQLAEALSTDVALDWKQGRILGSASEEHVGRVVLVPADWCLKRWANQSRLRPMTMLSTGVAAGPDWDWAAARAVLELVERDAASLWWIGGRRGRRVDIEAPEAREPARLLGSLRQGTSSRKTWLLDISTDVDIPVVAALSCSESGHQLACGLGSRPSLPLAARAAILELCQMELAVLLAEARAVQHGEMHLGSVDRQTLERSRLDALRCELFHPLEPCGSYEEMAGESELDAVSTRLQRAGVEVALVDLTRPESGVPVVRAVAPKLQLMPSGHVSPRLERCLADTGGGARFVGSVSLM